MEPTQFYVRKKTYYVAVLFGVALLILMFAEFASFGLGAYFVFNEPVSNVVAQTVASPNNSSFVQVQAMALDRNANRMVWIDPQITTDSNGSLYVNPNSGFLIGSSKTDDSGNLSGSFSLSTSKLEEISSDGNSIHTVWVFGFTNSSNPQSPDLRGITSDASQNYTIHTTGSGLTFFVTLITFSVPINFNLGQLFLVLWTIYIILFAMAMNGPIRSIASSIRQSANKGFGAIFDNSMFATLTVFPIVLWVTVAISLLEQASGVSTGSLPPTDPLLQLVELTIAPLREEIGFRVIPIGLVAFLLLLSRGRLRDGLLALWHPSRYLKKSDTPARYRRDLVWIYVMIAISAILFGLAHVLLGAGWGPGKILSAAVAGVGLAALYYIYGLPAAILLHWSIDYFLSIFDLNPALQSIGGWITLYTLLLSIAAGIVVAALLVNRFRSGQLGLLGRNTPRY